MKSKTIRVTHAEWLEIQRAVDFIESNSNGADDPRPYQKMMRALNRVFIRYRDNGKPCIAQRKAKRSEAIQCVYCGAILHRGQCPSCK